MKYMWSKNKIAKYLLPIILKDRKEWQWYVEPFVWGANMIDKVEWNRIWWEFNEYIAEMWIALEKWWLPKNNYTKEEFENIKKNVNNNLKYEVWYVWINLAYSWVWMSGFAWKVKTKIWTIRDYQDEAYRNILNQIPNIKWVKFIYSSYKDLEIPDNSIIYCDPPYKWTSQYKDKFNHYEFYEWCRDMKTKWHAIFISEYEMPEDFTCVWEMEVKSSLSANWKSWYSKQSIEKLFTL